MKKLIFTFRDFIIQDVGHIHYLAPPLLPLHLCLAQNAKFER